MAFSETLRIAAFTMGLFVAILPEARPERADFLSAHMAIGGAVFLLTFARMFERLVKLGFGQRRKMMFKLPKADDAANVWAYIASLSPAPAANCCVR